jgi:5-methylcytosine-specific restriction protein A
VIYKQCPRCKTVHDRNKPCPRGCYSFSKKESSKYYDKYLRKNKEVYNSSTWEKIRLRCLMRYDNICVYSLYKYQRVEVATTVHHIVEVNSDSERQLVYDMDNLIPLSDQAHREIHSRYKTEDIRAVQDELRKYKEMYCERVGGI